ncbi:MAG TPA: hypothetical protein VNE40_00170 [Candidatus Dormibacteraeota bacterium]|nr:hypothetical protein [Candidatus Dormibacteraeota bacterium]
MTKQTKATKKVSAGSSLDQSKSSPSVMTNTVLAIISLLILVIVGLLWRSLPASSPLPSTPQAILPDRTVALPTSYAVNGPASAINNNYGPSLQPAALANDGNSTTSAEGLQNAPANTQTAGPLSNQAIY